MQEKIFQAFHLEDALCASLLSAADKATQRYRALFPLSAAEQDAMKSYDEAFLIRFTYNSAAIEGSTLSLADTALVLEGEFMPSSPEDKRLSDLFAARGIADGVAFAHKLLERGAQLTEEAIKDIHERTALDCQPRTRGSYRTGAVYISGSETVPVAAAQVRPTMAALLFGYHNSPEPPLAKIAAFHMLFENIHPFTDGNGRTGRIVMNWQLQAHGYPPIAVKAADRAGYVQALEDWQVRNEPRSLLRLIAQFVEEEALARTEGVMQSRCLT